MAGSGPPAASGRIFISYRREETAYPAGWLYDRLADRFGGRQVFKDVDSIQLGDDFVEVITRAVGSCDVLVALIGDQWLTITDAHGRRRLDDPDDFVRLEIEAALTRKVRVIPILVDGARMPRADELPDSLVKLVRRQALELSPARFEFDTSRLLKVLDLTLAEVRTAQDDGELAPAEKVPDPTPGVVQETPAPPEQEQQRRPPAALAPPGGARPPSEGGVGPDRQRRRLSTRAWILAGVGVGVVLILLVVAIVANLQTTPSPNATPTDGQGATEAGGGIDVDSTPVTSPDDIRLTGLKAASGSVPASVGDTVTVSYSLTNAGDEPIRLEYTFVGVRNPAGENRDTEDMNEGRSLAPGETVNAQGRRLLDGAGAWEFWPCYVLSGERFCPDKWQSFEVLAR
jgi:TIR domain